MKKCIVFLLVLLMTFSFSACKDNSEDKQSSLVAEYKNKATEFIESGDTESAIKALEEGISSTGDNGLKKMLDKLKDGSAGEDEKETSTDDTGAGVDTESKPTENVDTSDIEPTDKPETSKPFDVTKYGGWWTETEDGLLYSGMSFGITDLYGDYLAFSISLFQANGYRSADTAFAVLKQSIKNNKFETAFEDSFCNLGFASIEFLEDKIICTISNFESPGQGSNWGIYDGKYILAYHVTEL